MTKTLPYLITIVGPESSGKTTFASTLAKELDCPWVPEFAREFLDRLDRPYAPDDLEVIAEGQRNLINEFAARTEGAGNINGSATHGNIDSNEPYFGIPDPEAVIDKMASEFSPFKAQRFVIRRPVSGQPVLVVDSGLLSLRIWAKLRYAKAIPFVEHDLGKDDTSMYVLCRPTLPWVADPLREAPGLLERAWIYNHYLAEIIRMRRMLSI